MAKKFNLKLRHNKSNGQFNITIPKKKLSKENLFNLKKSTGVRISIEEFF